MTTHATAGGPQLMPAPYALAVAKLAPEAQALVVAIGTAIVALKATRRAPETLAGVLRQVATDNREGAAITAAMLDTWAAMLDMEDDALPGTGEGRPVAN